MVPQREVMKIPTVRKADKQSEGVLNWRNKLSNLFLLSFFCAMKHVCACVCVHVLKYQIINCPSSKGLP